MGWIFTILTDHFTRETVNIVENRCRAAQRVRQCQQDSRVGHGRIKAQLGLRPDSVHRRVQPPAVTRANTNVIHAVQQQCRWGRSGHETDGLGFLGTRPTRKGCDTGRIVERQEIERSGESDKAANRHAISPQPTRIECQHGCVVGTRRVAHQDHAPAITAEAHRGMNVNEGAFFALVEELQKSMNAMNVPFAAQNRLIAALAPMHRDIIDR